MKKGYYEYDPVIYPRQLCVAIGMSQEDANKCFVGRNGETLEYDFANYDGISFDTIRKKADKKFCAFVVFPNKTSMTMGTCCHETSHICDAIENDIGMKHGGEPSAYLMGRIASCINKARLGIGDFVEIKDKNE